MHRTSTTAALLVTVAVSALSGCVTVQRPPAPGPPDTAPSQPSAPRPDGRATPKVVQAPAREALEMVGPSHDPERFAQSRPAAPSDTPRPASPRVPPRPQPHPAPSRHQRVEAPDVPRAAPPKPDICGLGKKYGGWRPGSPEARICERAYGR
ncbi:hypothetical protein [Streptomyces brasiliensis]|uniref:Lipoprotein n=1 Tax=Streptomyces brasiliensis TaxID=1954 RepID=A0A917LCV2_9ACTN|nr:hypothetical protein [Streptomyces brasiliensis]GGJ55600.1 lipoprotein [Streptomyces brasiliensis]